MKKYFYILIALILVLSVIFFIDFPYRLYVIIALSLAIGFIQFLMKKAIRDREFIGQLLIRKRRNSVDFVFILLIANLLILGIRKGWKENDVAIAGVILFIGTLVADRINRKEKSVYIAVNGQELLINEFRIRKLNIEDLTSINFNASSDSFTISFSGKSEIKLNKNNFDYDDLIKLFSYLLQHRKQNVIVSESLRGDLINNLSVGASYRNSKSFSVI
ncbi:MAG: hypothetical protein IPP79_23485 [Chitinophagaceae bacterium]|nr:hypothetical protein [Chitinophagaceae bacterium]